MPRAAGTKTSTTTRTKSPAETATKPRTAKSKSAATGSAAKTREPRAPNYMVEVFHDWYEHSELLGVIPITAKDKDEAFKIADALYHVPWTPYVPPMKQFDAERCEMRVWTVSEWQNRAAATLSKGKAKLAKVEAAEAAKPKRPKRTRKAVSESAGNPSTKAS